MDEVRIGFIPLVDCAVIVAAHERGFAERHGLRLVLSREPSWAAIRDKVAFGVLDAAHMLAPMPIAMTLGLGGQPSVPMLAPVGLGHGGNAITVSAALHRAMLDADADAMAGPPAWSARALAAVAARRRDRGQPRLRLASVYPFSCHDYELRLWLAAGGVAPDEVDLLVIPPPRMVENLSSGLVDGFCVGEPWNSLAQAEGIGAVVATKDDVAPAAPEKVLGLTRTWAEAHPAPLARLTSALAEAATWAAANRAELADLLAGETYVGIPADILARALALSGDTDDKGGRFTPAAAPLTPPQVTWLLDQMSRWRQIEPARGDAVRDVFRSAPVQQALTDLGP